MMIEVKFTLYNHSDLRSAAIHLTWYQTLILDFSAFLIFSNRSSCIVPRVEENLSVSIEKSVVYYTVLSNTAVFHIVVQ
jgi:hypothetical protein